MCVFLCVYVCVCVCVYVCVGVGVAVGGCGCMWLCVGVFLHVCMRVHVNLSSEHLSTYVRMYMLYIIQIRDTGIMIPVDRR